MPQQGQGYGEKITGDIEITGRAKTLIQGDSAHINNQTGTTYTLVLTDSGKKVILDNASPVAVTIPQNSSVAFPAGTQIDFIQKGAGKVTFSGSGVTINSKSSNKSIGAQYVGVTLLKTDTDTWYLFGDLIA